MDEHLGYNSTGSSDESAARLCVVAAAAAEAGAAGHGESQASGSGAC